MTERRLFWTLATSAALILAITMGIRQSLGLFVSPLNTSTGLGIVTVSFALAVGQFVWGAAQPVFGALADRAGSVRVIAIGGVLLALGLAATPFMKSDAGLIVSLGVLSAAGAGAGSFSILIGATAQRLSAERRAFASGFINAGGSLGQFVFAPLSQALIATIGWVGALWTLAVAALATLPLALPLRESKAGSAHGSVGQATHITLSEQTRIAFNDRSYWCLHAGFFTCGFHIAFLVTHLPGEVGLCGLPASVSATSLAIIGLANVAGSLGAGWLGQSHRMKMLLAWMYATRAVAIAVYLAAPKTPLTFYIFAAVLGLTWLATVPPTAGLVAKLFGTRHLATLFGLTLLSHQIGGFVGARPGGAGIAGARGAPYRSLPQPERSIAGRLNSSRDPKAIRHGFRILPQGPGAAPPRGGLHRPLRAALQPGMASLGRQGRISPAFPGRHEGTGEVRRVVEPVPAGTAQ